jgi:hypothetical protein
MSTDKPGPVGLAMVICDQILEDKLTNKKSLISIFNSIGTSQFPCRHPQLCVFVSLTEGQGESVAKLRIVHDETDKVLTEISGPIQFPDINAVVDLNFNLVGMEFPDPGLYSIEFYCDDLLVLERRFHVMQVQQPPPQGDPSSHEM